MNRPLFPGEVVEVDRTRNYHQQVYCSLINSGKVVGSLKMGAFCTDIFLFSE